MRFHIARELADGEERVVLTFGDSRRENPIVRHGIAMTPSILASIIRREDSPGTVRRRHFHHEQHLQFFMRWRRNNICDNLHINGVAPRVSIPSTDTSPEHSSSNSLTTSGIFNQAAKPRGVTPRMHNWGAFNT